MAVRTIIFRGKRIDNGEWVCGFMAMFTTIRNFGEVTSYDTRRSSKNT